MIPAAEPMPARYAIDADAIDDHHHERIVTLPSRGFFPLDLDTVHMYRTIHVRSWSEFDRARTSFGFTFILEFGSDAASEKYF